MKNFIYYINTLLPLTTVLLVLNLANSCRTSNELWRRELISKEHADTIIIDKKGNPYNVKRMEDNNLWMTSNLKLTIQGSYHYNDSIKYDEPYGRLYTWEAAQTGCACLGEGWRLPTKEDWQGLAEKYGAIGREESNIKKRAFFPLLNGGNSQFEAVLGGGRNPDGSYARMNAHGFYWTITEHDSTTAWFGNFAKGSQAFYIQPDGEKVRAFSVRCIKSIWSLKK